MSRWLRTPVLLFLLLCLPSMGNGGTLREGTYRRLVAAQELMEKGRLAEAEKQLKSLRASVAKHGYERAVVEQTWGYLQAARERYGQAIEAFRKALESGELPEDVALELRYNIAQLEAARERWRAAARAYEVWLAEAKSPSAGSYAFGAQVYTQLKEYAKAITAIRKAIAKADRPRESWYQLLAALHYRRHDLKSMAGVLEKMVTLWPRRARYWKQLASVHYLLGRKRRALAVMALAYRQGFLERESELLNLVNLYLQEKIPWKAARILEREMAAGRIRRSGRNLERLGEIWMQAREREEALAGLEAAARARKSGPLHLRLARLYYERDQWNEVIRHARKARSLGGLDNPGDAWLLEGMAQHELGWDELARRAFVQAERYSASATSARQWLAYIGQ